MCWKSKIEGNLSNNHDQQHVFTTSAQVKQVWKHMWKLKVQPRTKIFMWRLARNILPTRSKLLSKNITVGNR